MPFVCDDNCLGCPFLDRTTLSWIVDMSSLGAANGYAYASAAALKFAKKEGNKGTVFTGAIGLLMGLIFCILLLIPIPALNCSLGKESYICLIIWTVLGLIFYLTSKKRLNLFIN